MRRFLAFATLTVLTTACGDKGTEPVNYGPPTLLQVNGVTKPSGIVGMTVILEGTGLAEKQYGEVYFLDANGVAIAAPTDAAEWTNEYILAQVPAGTAAASKVWVETDWGTTDTLDFTLISGNTFSPSNINWTRTQDLPQALQGLGAVYVPVEGGDTPANYIFAIGGADADGVPTTAVYRGEVAASGAISAWTDAANQLPNPAAYHATAVATPYTAAIDTTAAAAYLYVLGGVDDLGAPVRTVLSAPVGLDGEVGTWASETNLPAPVRSATATIYRGYLYVVGGSDAAGLPVAAGYRTQISEDGSLGTWEQLPSLPAGVTHHAMVNFGPFVYVIGGDAAAVDAELPTPSGQETTNAYMGRIDMRDGTIAAWAPVTALNKARAKHGLVTAGGTVVVTSGMYSGQAGSSENSYATILPDGTIGSWGGATGTSTLETVLQYSLFNPAAVSFADPDGNAHVVVLGGGIRPDGGASAAVVYY